MMMQEDAAHVGGTDALSWELMLSLRTVNKQCSLWWWWWCKQTMLFVMSLDFSCKIKHCQRHNGPRVLSLWLELSFQLNWICNQLSCRLNSSFRLNTLGPLCLWQCFVLSGNFWYLSALLFPFGTFWHFFGTSWYNLVLSHTFLNFLVLLVVFGTSSRTLTYIWYFLALFWSFLVHFRTFWYISKHFGTF